MRRRDLIAATAVFSAVAPAALAEDAPTGGQSLNMPGVGLPIIVGGRLRNYVFVSLRLHLGGSATPEAMRAKEAYLRDALVRAGHRTPFVVADDLSRIDPAALSASLIRSASTIVGRGSVTRVEIVSQAPRRRTAGQTG
jgi:hypothetical protein